VAYNTFADITSIYGSIFIHLVVVATQICEI